MYSNNFVICVTVNNKPQKELPNGVVELTYGSEYSLRFRNKNNKRALVQFFIDGENVSGNGYIIPANDVIEIERFANVSNKFKFVPLDSDESIDYGKNGKQDGYKGLIEAKFFLEKEASIPYIPVPYAPYVPYEPYRPSPWRRPNPMFPYYGPYGPYGPDHRNTGSIYGAPGNLNYPRGTSAKVGATSKLNQHVDEDCLYTCDCAVNDGVTVEGSGSNQSFNPYYFDYDRSNPTILKIFLQGYDNEKYLKKSQLESQIKDLQDQLSKI